MISESANIRGPDGPVGRDQHDGRPHPTVMPLGSISATALSLHADEMKVFGHVQSTHAVQSTCPSYTLDCGNNTFQRGCEYPLRLDVDLLHVKTDGVIAGGAMQISARAVLRSSTARSPHPRSGIPPATLAATGPTTRSSRLGACLYHLLNRKPQSPARALARLMAVLAATLRGSRMSLRAVEGSNMTTRTRLATWDPARAVSRAVRAAACSI